MVNQIEYDDIVSMLYGMVEIIKREHQRLSQLDSISGDGDHGTTMTRAMKLVSKAIEQQENKNIKNLLESISWNILGVDGGATGPLLGTLFKGMAEFLEEGRPLTVSVFSQMFENGLTLIEKITKARAGDKTMMDALVPAVISLKESAQKERDFLDTLKTAAEAAKKGAETTESLVARFGRAKNLGEKTLGHPDPGAISMALLFEGFNEGLKRRRLL
jgi:phosphoenolpyruvate---glycerone phosphotransferase subunit DhaL